MKKNTVKRLHVGKKIGKYKLVKKMGDGAFGVVYKARDLVEGGYVALKINNEAASNSDILHYFKQEFRLLSRVEHKNVLKFKNADVYEDRLFFVSELGLGSLDEKDRRSIRVTFALDVLAQILEALIEVQKHNIVHRDIKPGNIILFPGNVAKLGDFGIAKVLEKAGKTLATDAGTRGYFAPEQIFGQPSFASDVFSLGLVVYEMITGELPRWPFSWPFVGKEKFNKRVPVGVRPVIKKALEVDERGRYADALTMYNDLLNARNNRNNSQSTVSRRRMLPWRKYRELEFSTRYSNLLELKFKCGECAGPISEYMMHCPWCGSEKNSFKGISSFSAVCKRCHHGVKDEWDYCPWCYGKKFTWSDVWLTEDRRYVKKCPNGRCSEKKTMRWMHYCPWCHAKIKPWVIKQLDGRCGKCRWSVASDYWDYCAWCGEDLRG